MKNINFFLSENFKSLEVKFSIYLNRRIFVMLLVLMMHKKFDIPSTYKSILSSCTKRAEMFSSETIMSK